MSTRPAAPVSLPVGNPAELTSLDVATAQMLGTEQREPLPRHDRDVDLDEIANDIFEPALESGRCLVAFSGGRESSWLLAAVVAGARSRGYPDPIPVTLRHAGPPGERAAKLQERVVAHLCLQDWERVTVDDELELLGPYARRALAEAGLLFPATAYSLLPLLDVARGGWLLSGGGVTDFFLYWRWARLSEVLAGRRLPRRRDLRELAAASLPAPLLGRRGEAPPPWLREDAAREVERRLGATRRVPLGFGAALARQRTHRCHTGMRRSLEKLADSAGARLMLPFRDDRYIAALASAGGRRGFGDRSSLVLQLAGHLLPAELLRRSDGAGGAQPFFGEASAAFAANWTGEGLDPDVVDANALRAGWSSSSFPWASTMLLQLAFAHDEALTAAGV